MRRSEVISVGGVAVVGAVMFRVVFGDVWAESIGLAVTIGVASLITQLASRRVRENRPARNVLAGRPRFALGLGIAFIATKVGLDIAKLSASDVRAVFGIVGIMWLLVAAYEITKRSQAAK